MRCVAMLAAAAGAATSPANATESAPVEAGAALRLMKTRCFSCHNEQKHKGGLVMTSREALLKGGENGAAVVAGAPGESAMIAALAPDADPHMPPKKQLSPTQIELLSSWVKAGAPWDAAALVEQPRQVVLAPPPAGFRPVMALALSPDGKRLAVGFGNELVIYEVTEKDLALVARASAHPDPIQSLAWNLDGTQIATGAFRRVVIWDARDLDARTTLTAGLTDRISAVRFLPDGVRLAIADGRMAENGTVRIADVPSAGIVNAWTAHEDTIFDLTVSADGRLLATAGGDKLVKVWDLGTQQEIARIEAHAAQVLTVAFNADATQLVTGGADQQLKGWDVKSRDQIMLLGRHTAGINGAAWAPSVPALFAVTDAGGLLRYSDFKTHSGAQSSDSAKEQKLEATDSALYCVAVTSNGERVFAGAHDGRVLGWNKDGKLVTKMAVQDTKATAAK